MITRLEGRGLPLLLVLGLLGLPWVGCGEEDLDGDGVTVEAGDCNDSDANIHPGLGESCDGVDQNCDGNIDEGLSGAWYPDTDGDGYGDDAGLQESCATPGDGWVTDAGDCDDTLKEVNPQAREVCNGIDDDCNGKLDDGDGNVQKAPTWYEDLDGDGYGNRNVEAIACIAPKNFVDNADDCNDLEAAIHPEAEETCDGVDEDCDDVADNGVPTSSWYEDGDADGYGKTSSKVTACASPGDEYVLEAGDCDDYDDDIYPGAREVCNGADDDCDGKKDDADASLEDAPLWYLDGDADGYGSGTGKPGCTQLPGYQAEAGDCNDGNAAINPGAPDICDTIDNDCDGTSDNGTLYLDSDHDGHGDADHSLSACSAGEDYVTVGDDCDDSMASTYPGATEVCNSLDDDCDLAIDEGVKHTYYQDQDGDNFGTLSYSLEACEAPDGYVSDSRDCNDLDASVRPGVLETCNTIDDNCNNIVDEGIPTTTYYYDADGDGAGGVNNWVVTCKAPSSRFLLEGGDCDDFNAELHPKAEERCDMKDNDCDGTIDEGVGPIQVSGGYAFSAMLCPDGSVWAWGDNGYGQLGQGDTQARAEWVQVKSLAAVVSIASGPGYTLALTEEGALYGWGDNASGQLGQVGSSIRSTPVEVPVGGQVLSYAAGFTHALAVVAEEGQSLGQVWGWGENSYGQLGQGKTSGPMVPTEVPGLNKVSRVAAGEAHSLALLEDGTVKAWGGNYYGELGNAEAGSLETTPGAVWNLYDVVTIAAGPSRSYAVLEDGTVWGWGDNYACELGVGEGGDLMEIVARQLTALSNLETISLGWDHGVALRDNGTVWVWGNNSSGQLGLGDAQSRCTPEQVKTLTTVVSASAGGHHSLSVDAGGAVHTWGDNDYRQLGSSISLSAYVPITPEITYHVLDIAAGRDHGFFLRSDGSVWGWGRNNHGQLGDGTTDDQEAPVRVQGLSDPADLFAGGDHSLALLKDGTLVAWGANGEGQLGDGSREDRRQPVPVKNLKNIKYVAVGGQYTLALDNAGIAYAWGDNTFGQLGDGTTVDHSLPSPVAGLYRTVSGIAAGEDHALAILSDYTVWAWGANDLGQLGDRSFADSSSPVLVYFPPDAVYHPLRISAGETHSLAVGSDGTLWSWGSNLSGQLGNGQGEESDLPVPVIIVNGLQQVEGGRNHSLAYTPDGAVWGWGDNDFGQLGDGTTTDRPLPVIVPDVVVPWTVQAGGDHNLALTRDGQVWAWGRNDMGQLGNGYRANGVRPTRVLCTTPPL